MNRVSVGLLAAFAAMAQSPNTSRVASAGTKNQVEFVKIAPGECLMGCVPGDKDCLEDEVPRHKVRLTKGFEIGKYEVTQAQWEGCDGPPFEPQPDFGPE
jgi:formylglycine-generating enzyme required for sulfatase activity